MDDFYKTLSGWLVAAIMALWTLVSSRNGKREKDFNDKLKHLERMSNQHDKAIGEQRIHNDNIHSDMESLKKSVGSINDKLDRLIERR